MATEQRMSILKTTPGRAPAVTVNLQKPDVVALTLRVRDAGCACDHARRFADRTFAVADAPTLPLHNCDRTDCRCSYERVADRRKGERRSRADRRDEIRFEKKTDRRGGKDRRSIHSAWNSSSTV
jgi:hypothetical protein